MRQQGFSNQMSLAQGRAGVGSTAMGYYGSEAARKQKQLAQVGDALGKGVGSLGSNDDENTARMPGTYYDPYGGGY
jgi:hypothetical protein